MTVCNAMFTGNVVCMLGMQLVFVRNMSKNAIGMQSLIVWWSKSTYCISLEQIKLWLNFAYLFLYLCAKASDIIKQQYKSDSALLENIVKRRLTMFHLHALHVSCTGYSNYLDKCSSIYYFETPLYVIWDIQM